MLWRQIHPPGSHMVPFPIMIPDWSQLPSWSWATIGSAVQWYGTIQELRTAEHVEELCSVTIEDSDMPYPTLRIAGQPMKMCPQEDVLSISAAINLHGIPEKPVASFHHLGFTCRYELDSWFLHQTWDNASGDEDRFFDSLISSTVILPVIWDDKDLYQVYGAQCLLLWRDPGFGKGVYRRVGLVKMEDTQGSRARYLPSSHLVRWAKHYSKDLPEQDFVEQGEQGDFQIELI